MPLWWSLHPGSHWGVYSALPDSPAGYEDMVGRQGKGKEEGREKEGRKKLKKEA